MVKKNLMLGAAFAALSLIPMTQAQAEDVDVDISATWDNTVNVELDWTVAVDKAVGIVGFITIDGSVVADALAHATLDDKQISDNNNVAFEDYQNANSNSEDDNAAEPGLGTGAVDASEEGAPHAATYNNTLTANLTGTTVSGNIGINLAAGDFNLQENAAVIASAEALAIVVDPSTGEVLGGGGGAEAGSFSLQNLYNNEFNEGSFSGLDEQNPEIENTNIDNTITIGGSLNAATGNIGLNAAAGAFNIQKNALVIATVTGGNLAEATSGVFQDTEFNSSTIEDVTNAATLNSALTGSSGNIGVNLAAGVGNLQLNTLTIANAVGAGDVAPTAPSGPTGPTGPTGTIPGG